MCKNKNLIRCIALGLLLGMMAGATNAEIIAYWPFEEGEGNVAKDVVSDIEATLTGVTWVPGHGGGFALNSGASGTRSILAGSAPTPTTKDISLAWWMVDRYASYQTLMNKGLDSSVAGHYILLRPSTGEDSPLRFRIGGFQAYGSWGTECRVPQGAYQDGEWTHVVCTFDYASDTATIYINGELKPNGAYNPKTGIAGPSGYCQGVNDPAQPLYIVGQRETFQGDVDEVAIWDHALSPVDVAKVYVLGPLALDPRMAGSPKPADKATDVVREAILEWKPGKDAVSHDVYLGTVFEDVNAAGTDSPLLRQKGQAATTYDPPGRLDFGTTYYWRIDETSTSKMTGSTWRFTTEPVAYLITDVQATASSSSSAATEPANLVNGSGLTLATDGQWVHGTDEKTMWQSAPSGLPATVVFEFDRSYKLHEMKLWNHNTSNEILFGLGAKEVTIEVGDSNEGPWTAVADVTLTKASGLPNMPATDTIPMLGVMAHNVRLTIRSSQGGFATAGLAEVRFLYIPVAARELTPADGTALTVSEATLAWRSGREAAEHRVYLATAEERTLVEGSDPAALEATVPAQGPYASYTATGLNLLQTYLWKITEVNVAEIPATHDSPILSFTMPEYLVVDDFESYTNDSPKRVFQTWIDGLGFSSDEFFSKGNNGNGSGSMVGYDPLAGQILETTTRHGGAKSLPLFYDNTAATYSETTRTFGSPQDWSKHNIQALALWFYGDATNDTQQMYVKINNAKILYDGEATNLKMPGWRMWYISLAGQSVSSVTSISIGFDKLGGVGGSGKVLIDDLRLYSYDRQLVTPVSPGTAGLQLQYLFDGNANDSSGKGRNGSLKGTPMFVAGKAGQAISLNGTADYVNIDGYKGILADAAGVQQAFTVCAWIKTATNGRDIIAWGTNASGQRMNFRVDTVLRVEHAGGNIRGTNGPSLIDDEWHHVAATVPQGGTLPDTRLYVDGSDASAPASATAAYNLKANVDVAIGMGGSIATGRFFQGLIDDARIYDRVLSPGEVAWLAGRTIPFDKSF